MHSVPADVLDGVEESTRAAGRDGAVAEGEDIVAPGSASYGWRGGCAGEAYWSAIEGVDAGVICGCGHDYVGF